MNEPLTARQAAILAFIRRQIDDRGYPPSHREVMREFDFASTQAAACHFTALQKKGYIARDPGVARGIRLLKREGT